MLKNWLKKFLGIDFIEGMIKTLDGRVDGLISIREEPEVKLLRHLLGSIDLSDIPEKEMTKEERDAFLSNVAVLYPNTIESEIKKMIFEQLNFIGKEADGVTQFTFARGTINGLFLLDERFKDYYEEYKQLVKPKESYDKTKLFPEI